MNVTRFRWIALLLVFFGAVPLAAQGPPQPAPPGRHCLWSVRGSSNTVYILGSIHFLNRTNYPLARPILSAFTNSAIVAFETDIEKLEQPETQRQLLGKAVLPAGKTLATELSAPVYAQFSNHLAAAGLPVFLFNHFKPFMAAMTLEVLEMQSLGAAPEYGVDRYFFRRARKAGRQIVPLETVEHQIELLTSFSPEEGEALLKATLENLDTTRKVLRELVAAWEQGDVSQLETMLNEAMQETPVLFNRLVTERNERWIPKIERLLRENKNAIVIVGAGHLVGSQGVIELLKARSWSVTQL